MPKVKDFQNENPHQEQVSVDGETPKKHKSKRRPGREHAHVADETKVEHHADLADEAKANDSSKEAPKARITLDLDIPVVQMLKTRAPRAFGVAEQVANDWINDGDFMGLDVGHPLVQIAVGTGLKTAKKVEKKVVSKLEEKGVITLAKMGLEIAKSKLKR